MRTLAIIPARKGSKGVPGKNKIPINGKPLIMYSVEVALQCGLFSHIVVSTDDEEIIEMCALPGITIDRRPDHLASDESPIVLTVERIVRQMEADMSIDIICLLQPTAPFRTTAHISQALDIIKNDPETNAVISVSAMNDMHPARMYILENDFLKPYVPEYEQKRRQDIPIAYYRNGSIYLVRVSAFLDQNAIMAKPAKPYVMHLDYLCNIDEPRDIIIAEALAKYLNI